MIFANKKCYWAFETKMGQSIQVTATLPLQTAKEKGDQGNSVLYFEKMLGEGFRAQVRESVEKLNKDR